MGPTASRLKSTWNTTTSLRPIHFHHKMIMTHMTFFWGHSAEILFPDWPGPNSKPMYALALIFVFTLAVIVEWLNYSSIITKPGTNKVAAGFFQTGLHAVRTGLSYMVILAVMSFNGGVFLAAVGGHTIGFLVFRSWAFRKSVTGPSGPPSRIFQSSSL